MLWDHKAPRHLVHVVAVVVSWLLTTHWHECHDAVAIHTAQAFRLVLLHCPKLVWVYILISHAPLCDGAKRHDRVAQQEIDRDDTRRPIGGRALESHQVL